MRWNIHKHGVMNCEGGHEQYVDTAYRQDGGEYVQRRI